MILRVGPTSAKPVNDGEYPSRIILHEEYGEYMTHLEVFPTEEGRSPHKIMGHYFFSNEREAAEKDFDMRVKRGY